MVSCASAPENTKNTELETTWSVYQGAMHWKYCDTLIGFYSAPVAKETLAKLDNVRVTAYEVRHSPMVEIQYVLNSEQMLRKVIDRQEWRYAKTRKSWLIFSPFPLFEK
ncbi:hypothetical protein TI04_00945 [Achromatium sp. WMS2]|nr:hypothetical protein TI04_00945 [Achromatium sp. WMS2]